MSQLSQSNASCTHFAIILPSQLRLLLWRQSWMLACVSFGEIYYVNVIIDISDTNLFWYVWLRFIDSSSRKCNYRHEGVSLAAILNALRRWMAKQIWDDSIREIVYSRLGYKRLNRHNDFFTRMWHFTSCVKQIRLMLPVSRIESPYPLLWEEAWNICRHDLNILVLSTGT